MNTTKDITPRVAPRNIRKVVKQYNGGRPDGVDLDNGVYVRLVGDGKGHGDDGRTYVAVSRGIGERYEDGTYDEYEFLGYADINDTEDYPA